MSYGYGGYGYGTFAAAKRGIRRGDGDLGRQAIIIDSGGGGVSSGGGDVEARGDGDRLESQDELSGRVMRQAAVPVFAMTGCLVIVQLFQVVAPCHEHEQQGGDVALGSGGGVFGTMSAESMGMNMGMGRGACLLVLRAVELWVRPLVLFAIGVTCTLFLYRSVCWVFGVRPWPFARLG